MDTYRPWLPGVAIERGARDVPLRQAVADWSSKWFARQPATQAGDPAVTSALDWRGSGVWELVDGLMVVPAADADQAMIALLFGPRDDGATPAATDQAVLQAVVDACSADLRSRLATAFRLPADAAWRPASTSADAIRRWVWRIETGRGAGVLRVAADEALIARLIRAVLPPTAAERPLATLATALAGQPVDVSALVGRCRLTTAELGDLAQGDVVVLDRMLGGPVDLAVDGEPKPLPCTVDERDGRLTLTLVD